MRWHAKRQPYKPSGACSTGCHNDAKLQVIVPEVIRAVQPDMKMIVIMREPISRMYSAFWYYGCLYGNKAKPLTPEAFDTSARQEVSVIQSCVDGGASMRACVRQHFHAAQQLVKGMYAAYAPDWLAVYPPHQIMWLRAEDYYQDERAHLEVCTSLFLIIDASYKSMQHRAAYSAYHC